MEYSEVPNNEDVAARREARRRKISENSKSRLSRITGREHTEEVVENTSADTEEQPQERVIYPDPEIERDVYIPQLINDIEEKQFFELFNSLQQQQSAGNANPNSNTFAAFAQFGNFDGNASSHPLFGNVNNQEVPKVPETRLQKFLNTKIHIGLLSLLTYSLISMASFHWNVFLLFLVWEIAEIFILRQYESNSNGVVNVVFMLAGVSPTKMNVILKWIQLLNKVLRDVALFMLFFVLAHLCQPYNYQSQTIPNVSIVVDSPDDTFEHFEF